MTYPALANAADLTFETPAGAGLPGQVDLTFGATQGPPPGVVYDMTLNVRIGLGVAVSVNYDSGQWRGLRSDTVVPHSEAASANKLTATVWDGSAHVSPLSALSFGQASKAEAGRDVAWSIPTRGQSVTAGLWGLAADTVGSTAPGGWARSALTSRISRSPWSESAPRNQQQGARFGIAKSTPVSLISNWQTALALGVGVTSRLNRAAKLFKVATVAPWQVAELLQSYGGPRYLPPPRPVDPEPPVVTRDVHFCWEYASQGFDFSSVALAFGVNYCNAFRPRKVYFIVNELLLIRVSNSDEIRVNSLSVGIDRDSWCWALDATLPHTELSKVDPSSGPVEVELTLNGLVWRFIVETYSKKQSFGKTSIQIRGRSATAYLDNPYAPVRSYAQTTTLTSRQLAENELTRPGLETGFSLDWQLVDVLGWQMPAGTWGYTDMTPMQVIKAIAEGAGGYVNSHPSTRSVIVLPDYSAPSWAWATEPTVKTLPYDILKTQSVQWLEKPAYNGVYVSGELTGVNALVRRTGTIGDYQAPMYVNPMISASGAARAKGLSILSAGGKQANVDLDMPMEPSVGLVTPGTLIEVSGGPEGWRGMVRGTSISASWGTGLSITQTLNIERHFWS